MAQVTTDGLSLGERMHLARRRLGLNLATVARLVGIDLSSLSRYERDLRDPPAQILRKIAEVLETTPDALLGFSTDTDTPGYPNDVPLSADVSREKAA